MADSIAITLDDTSPTIAYAPFVDTSSTPDLSAGWNLFYTLSGFATGVSGSGPDNSEIGNGTSLHVTELDGAALQIIWNGTAISLRGLFRPSSSTPIPYTVSLDGTATTNYASTTGVLAAFTNLTLTEHVVVLTVHNPNSTDTNNVTDSVNAMVAFDQAVVLSELDSNVTSPSAPTSTSTLDTQPVPDDSISFNGQWSFSSDLLPGQNATFHTSTHVGDRAVLVFNGTAVVLSGLVSPSSGSYNVSLDGLPIETYSALASVTPPEPIVLFFHTDLDANVMHELEVINAGALASGEGSLLMVSGVNVSTLVTSSNISSFPAASSPLATGEIVAIVLGAVIALIVVAVLTLVVIRRRRRNIQRKRQFIVHPRVKNGFRLSFFGRASTRGSQPPDPESAVPQSVLDISKTEDDGAGEKSEHNEKIEQITARRHTRNSDGSFSIDLPDRPAPATPQGYEPVQNRSPESSPMRFSLPRSPKPRGPRLMQSIRHTRDGSQGILLAQMASSGQEEENSAPPLDVPQPAVVAGSPLRVEFVDVADSIVGDEQRGRRNTMASAFSLPHSLIRALTGGGGEPADKPPKAMGTSSSSYRDTVHSFLDFSSRSTSSSGSRARSVRQGASNSTQSSSSKSQGNATSSFEPGSPLGISVAIGRGPTSSRPSLTPEISLKRVSLSPPSIPPLPAMPRIDTSDPGLNPEPAAVVPSPTDSIPLTVSDIHFRHESYTSSSFSDSRRTSTNRISGSHRSPHPPLPGPRPDPPPFIVQKLLGLPSGEGPSTPYSTPPAPTPAPAPVSSTPEPPSTVRSQYLAPPHPGPSSMGYRFGTGRRR